MAFSSSIKRAQDIKLCEVCQEGSIKWRCIDCDVCLCDRCKTLHSRFPATAQHQIVSIGTPVQEVQKKIIIDNIPCKDHPKKMVCLFCRSCYTLICPDCAYSTHNKHNFDSIESAVDEKLNSLRRINDKVNSNLKSCESKNSDIQNITSIYNAIFDESLTKIKQKEEELIDVIRQHSNDLQEKVENERSRINCMISKIQQDIDNQKKILEDQREEVESILNSNQGNIIFNANMIIKELQFESLPSQTEEFIPEAKSKDEIHKLFGSLQKLYITKTNGSEIELKIVRTFTTDLPYIEEVTTVDKTSAWISCYHTPVIRKMNIQDNNITTSQELSLEVYDMAVTSNNELLLSMSDGSDVKLLKRSGEIVNLLTVAPLFSLGIHMTKNNDIILGVKEFGNYFTPTEQSQRAVIVMDSNGKEKQRYSRDEEGNRLFTIPKRIRTNYNHDIIVVDIASKITGRVVVLNREGKLRWIYEGHNEINASKQFDPRGIVTTTAGHIVVTDRGSHAIHVLSEDGEVLTCKVLRAMGIIYPMGLDIDDEGMVWLGCGTGGEKSGAKLHMIKPIP